MSETRASKFLDLIRRSERGRLKVYLGFAPGVGKTFQMLQEAHRLKREGIDVVVGLVETHNRAETSALVDGLEVLPRRRTDYKGITVEEFDVDACLARRPQVAVVDELAHTNVPGSRNAKRYEDVQELLAAGTHVITAMNVQHLESLYNTVEHLVGVKVRERVPDGVLADADQVVNVDLSPEDLQKRLGEGKIYPRDRVAPSLANFFRGGNLEHLRELALRELASQIDARRRERPDGAAPPSGNDQVMVCLSSKGGSSARLLRYGSRLAGRLNRNWYAVYVQTPAEEPTRIDSTRQRLLADTLTLANQLGATVFTFRGADVPETILRFAREYRVGQVVIGKPHPLSLWQRLALRQRSVAERLIFRARGLTVIVIDADAEEVAPSPAGGAPSYDELGFEGNSGATPDTSSADIPSAAAVVPVNPTPDTSTAPGNGVGGAAGIGAGAGVGWAVVVAASAAPPGAPASSAPAPPRRTLASILKPSRVMIWDNPITIVQLFRSLAASVSLDDPRLDVDDVVRLLLEREAQGSTFLNEGVALPHARLGHLTEPQVALGVTHAGLLDADVDRPVRAVFLLLSPTAATAEHLRVLAVAAKALQRKETRAKLARARTPADVLAALDT